MTAVIVAAILLITGITGTATVIGAAKARRETLLRCGECGYRNTPDLVFWHRVIAHGKEDG